MTVALDIADQRILNILQADASLSTIEIAERVGISQAPCWRRIRRLEETGIIRGRVVLLDSKKIGLPVTVFANIKLSAHGKTTLPEFEQSIRRFPEVVECFTLSGETDYILKIVVPSVEAYERFYREKLSQLPAVRETNSAIVLSEIKNSTILPLTLS